MKTTNPPTHPYSSSLAKPSASAPRLFSALTAVLVAVAGSVWSSGGRGQAHAQPAFHGRPAAQHRLLQVAGAPPAPITLPIEVMGRDGTAVSLGLSLTAAQARASQLWMQVHGLSYADKASIQVNRGPWIALDNVSVSVEEPGKSYGGIGGSFSTLKLSLALRPPLTRLQPGLNQISFRFNHTDGVSIGFRVLKLQMLDRLGRPLLPASAFAQDDPSQWQPPLAGADDIAEGSRLWHSAPLQGSTLVGAPVLLATCADCHTHDGRDLKYFNFSNHSIIERSKFHGLTAQQGAQIASYIRTLKNADGTDMPSPGAPWNPPYQPGPGLDAKPVSDWAAGAGVDAVLTHDSDMLPYMFPGGVNPAAQPESVSPAGTLNMRELPISLQLLDWNHWLPKIHPKDAWGADFTASGLNTDYTFLYNALLDPAHNTWVNTPRLPAEIGHWSSGYLGQFMQGRQWDNGGPTYTPEYSEKIYSTHLWLTVKTWEMEQEFGLEDNPARFFGNPATVEPRAWISSKPFLTSMKLSRTADGNNLAISGRTELEYEYHNNSWYELQEILNFGQRQRNGNNPIDFNYIYGTLDQLDQATGINEGMRQYALITKAIQDFNNNLPSPNSIGYLGWSPHGIPLAEMGFAHAAAQGLDSVPGGAMTRAKMTTLLVSNWLTKMQQYAPSQYYAAGEFQPTDNPAGGYSFANQMYTVVIPNFRAMGVDDALLNSVCDYMGTLFPPNAALFAAEKTTAGPHNGTLVRSPSFAATGDAFGSALSLNGTNQYVTLPAPGPADPNRISNWTAECRVKTSYSNGNGLNVQVVLSDGNPGAPGTGWLIGVTGTGKPQFIAGGLGAGVIGRTSINNGQWHSLAMTMGGNGTTMTAYVDGVQIGTSTGQYNAPYYMPQSSALIGSYVGGLVRDQARSWPIQISEAAYSNVVQYTGNYTPATAPFSSSRAGQTALYHLSADASDSTRQ